MNKLIQTYKTKQEHRADGKKMEPTKKASMTWRDGKTQT